MYVRKIMLRVPSGVIRLIDFDARGDVRVVELGGLAYVVLHLFGDLVARIDGLHRALWHAHGAVDALSGVDHELVIGVVDAIHWARPYAGRVLRADTQFGNNIGHALPLCSVGRLLHASIIPARSLPPTRAALRVGKRSVKDIRFSGLIHPSDPWPLAGHTEGMKMSCRRDYFHTRLASFELGGAKAYRSNKEVFARVESGRDNRCQKPRPEARVAEGRRRPPRTPAVSLALIHKVRGRGILRSSPCLQGNAEALWQEYHGLGPKGWPAGLARCAQAAGRSMHRVRRARDESREPRLLWAGLRLSQGGDEGRAREGTLHRSALRWDRG